MGSLIENFPGAVPPPSKPGSHLGRKLVVLVGAGLALAGATGTVHDKAVKLGVIDPSEDKKSEPAAPRVLPAVEVDDKALDLLLKCIVDDAYTRCRAISRSAFAEDNCDELPGRDVGDTIDPRKKAFAKAGYPDLLSYECAGQGTPGAALHQRTDSYQVSRHTGVHLRGSRHQ